MSESIPTYHERVARVMARSITVGTFYSYDCILAHLLARFSEAQLRDFVKQSELRLAPMTPGFQFIRDDTLH